MSTEEREIVIDKGHYLEEIKESLPSGKIFKVVTGIGATQKEIKDSTRNSIIVCPTRHLAATKTIKHQNDLLIYYLGSQYPNVEESNVEAIIQALKKGERIKIMIVADSFVNHYPKLKDYLDQFFVMFDEIDSFQSESNYRPNLERCLEIYFTLKPSLRCMISATIQVSNYKKFEEEPLTEITVNGHELPGIETVYCKGSIIKTAAEIISDCYKTKNPDEKIIVAYNSIIGITDIITILEPNLQSLAGILCSPSNPEESEIVEKYYIELEEGKLKKEITFMTCAFFAGIDIDEKAQVIIIADIAHEFSLLTFAKIYQIYGRPRQGATKKIFLFNVYAKSAERTIAFMKESIANKIAYIKKEVATIRSHVKSKDESELESDIKSIIDANLYQGVALMRYENKHLKENYLNVDYLLHRQGAKNAIYSDPVLALENLNKYFTVTKSSIETVKLTDEEEEEIGNKRTKHREDKAYKKILSNIDIKFNSYSIGSDPENMFSQKVLAPEREKEAFLKSIKSKKTLSREDKIGIEDIIEYFNLNEKAGIYKFLKYKLQVLAYLKNKRTSKFWQAINKEFVIGTKLSSKEIEDKMKVILPKMESEFNVTYNLKPKPRGEATKLLNLFLKTSRSHNKILIGGYRGILLDDEDESVVMEENEDES